MINPIAGKGWNVGWELERFLPKAVAFYREVEELTGGEFYTEMWIERRIETAKDLRKVQGKLSELEPWINLQRSSDEALFIRGGRLWTTRFLDLTREFFIDQGYFHTRTRSDEAETVVLCEGFEGLQRVGIKHRSAKGQIITVRSQSPLQDILVSQGVWVVPEGEGQFRVGATYEWDVLDQVPSEAGKDHLLTKACLVLGEVTLVKHEAGVRPILRQSQPVIGELECGDWIFNGLGSKGGIYAPRTAAYLVDHLLKGHALPEDLNYHFWRNENL